MIKLLGNIPSEIKLIRPEAVRAKGVCQVFLSSDRYGYLIILHV